MRRRTGRKHPWNYGLSPCSCFSLCPPVRAHHSRCTTQVELSGAAKGKAVWPSNLKPVAWHKDSEMVRMKLGLYHSIHNVADGEVEYKDISIEGPKGIIRTSAVVDSKSRALDFDETCELDSCESDFYTERVSSPLNILPRWIRFPSKKDGASYSFARDLANSTRIKFLSRAERRPRTVNRASTRRKRSFVSRWKTT